MNVAAVFSKVAYFIMSVKIATPSIYSLPGKSLDSFQVEGLFVFLNVTAFFVFIVCLVLSNLALGTI